MKLDAWLKQNRSLEEQLRLIERLCQAVNEIHDRGETVGALAPGRIDVGSDDRCDLSAAGKGSPRPPYAPPEGEQGGATLADIYAAGVISWEILAGQPAGPAPAHLTEVRPDLPRELADAVMACLEESPEWRPNDLTYLAQMAAARQRPPGRKAVAAARAPSPPRTTPKPRRRGPSRRTWPLLLALVVVLALGALAARQYLGGDGAPSASTDPPPTTAPAPPAPPAAAPEPRTRAAEPIPDEATPPDAPAPGDEPPLDPPPPAAPPRDSAPVETPDAAPPEPRVAAPAPERPVPVEAAAPSPVAVEDAPPPATAEPALPPAPPPAAAVESRPAPEPAPPTATQAPVEAPVPPLEPAALSAVAPPTVKRPGKVLVDLRGKGLHPQHRARILPVKKVPWGITVVRQKHVSDTLITILLQLEETAEPGEYAIAVEDGQGTRSEPLVFTVTR